MITLVFLVCNPVIGCMTYTPEQVFKTEAICHDVAAQVMEDASRQVQRGELAPHTATYKCIKWGEPS